MNTANTSCGTGPNKTPFEYPVYIPRPPVCHMDQYHCCKHRQQCRLYPVCTQITKQSVCQRDCPNCTYEGCSLPMENRHLAPVYIAGVIQGERLDMDLEGRYWREQVDHRKKHRAGYRFYNSLWGDLREKTRQKCRERYHADPEYYRMLSRESYRRRHPPALDKEKYRIKLMPECGMKCNECTLGDCTLPEDWREKELNRIRNRRYYAAHRDKLCEIQKERRKRPEERAWRAEYNRKYQKDHPEKTRERTRRYREKHPERYLESQRAYRQKNKDKINAKRREKRNGTKRSAENSPHREM